MASVCDLPFDVWAMIFQFLDLPSLAVLRLCVCRFFKYAIPSNIYPSLDLQCYNHSIAFRQREVASLITEFIPGKSVLRDWVQVLEPEFFNKEELDQLTQLHALKIRKPCLRITKSSSLNKLDSELHIWSRITLDGIDESVSFSGTATNLTNLKCGSWRYAHECVIPVLHETFDAPQLRVLSIESRDTRMWPRIWALLKRVMIRDTLEDLMLSTPATEQDIFLRIPCSLKYLYVKGPKAVCLIPGNSTSLRDLIVPDTMVHAPAQLLSRLETLETLNFNLVVSMELQTLYLDLHFFANKSLSLNNMPKLQYLDLLRTDQIDMVELNDLPNLSTLALHSCHNPGRVRLMNLKKQLDVLTVDDSVVVVDALMFPQHIYPKTLEIFGYHSRVCFCYTEPQVVLPVQHVKLDCYYREDNLFFWCPAIDNISVHPSINHHNNMFDWSVLRTKSLSIFFPNESNFNFTVFIRRCPELCELTVRGPVLVHVDIFSCPMLQDVNTIGDALIL